MFAGNEISLLAELGYDARESLSDDDYAQMELDVGALCASQGFDENDELTERGRICESILDKLAKL